MSDFLLKFVHHPLSDLSILKLAVAVLFFSATATGQSDDVVSPNSTLSKNDVLMVKGESIWKKNCADCHGVRGEGVKGIYSDALTGDDTVGQLAEVISATMPEGEPAACVAEDAQAVAAWIHHSFYSEAARLRNRPPRTMLTRLTGTQLQQSYADLYGHFAGAMWRDKNRGLTASYFDGARWKKENLRIERTDPYIHFDWGKKSPGDGISDEEFYVLWKGGLKVDRSGRYELVFRSTAAFKFEFGRHDRMLIDNHVQSGDKTEFRRSVTLLAGRVYLLDIQLYQRKRKTEQPPVSVSLSWVPPGGTEQIVPTRNLIPASSPATFALQTRMPPDDRSYGFERGLSVDRQWDDATTNAAVEFSKIATTELWPEYSRRNKKVPIEGRQRLRSFIGQIAEIAFRGPLDEQARAFYIDAQIDATEDDTEAIQRSLLTILKSPRFLYPTLDQDRSPARQAANRLALTLYDSLPSDQWLLKAIDENKLTTEQQLRDAAWRMVNDYRCEGKVRQMLYEWLNLSHIGEIAKSRDVFPDFDEHVVSDLRDSLDNFLDDAAFTNGGDFRKFFNARWTYTNSRLAKFYGPEWHVTKNDNPAEPKADSADQADNSNGPEGSDASEETDAATNPEGEFRGLLPVESLTRTDEMEDRRGLLTHPFLASGLAYSETSSPIHRGVFLVRYMLGRTLRPPNEAFTPLSPDLHPNLTTRERVQLQTSPEACQVCHQKINSLGFALENFDAVGRFRKKEEGKPVNSSGSYIERSGREITFTGASELAEYLAVSDDAHRAFVNRAFQHFVKQPVAAFGPETLDRLTETFRASSFNIRELLVEIAITAASPPTTESPTSKEDS